MIIHWSGSWGQLRLKVLDVPEAAVTRAVIASCRKTQTPRTAYGTRPFIGTISPRLCVVLPSHRASVGVESSPVALSVRPSEKLVQRNDCCGRCSFFSSALPEVWCFSASSKLVRLNRFSTEHFGCCNYDCPSLIHNSSGRKTCHTAYDRSHKTSRELDPPRLLHFSSSSPRTSTSTRSEFPSLRKFIS